MDFTRASFIRALGGITLAWPAVSTLSSCAKQHSEMFSYTAQAMGIDVDFQFHAPSQKAADAVFKKAMQEITRLNAIFSLYDPRSEISRLNRDGYLKNAAPDFIDLITRAKAFHTASLGAFDITVQPLWTLYQSTTNPSPEALDEALSRIGSQYISVKDRDISFQKPGMAITVNGCAQGYISDAVVNVLGQNGVKHGLVNIGEYAALGAKPDGQPWILGIQDPVNPIDIVKTVKLDGQALATSGGYGGLFSDDGSVTHIFDPRNGVSPSLYKSISVIADEAFLADAMSTGFLSLTKSEISKVKSEYTGIDQIVIIELDGQITRL